MLEFSITNAIGMPQFHYYYDFQRIKKYQQYASSYFTARRYK